MTARHAVLTALAIGLLSAPAAASGATIAVDHDCYVQSTASQRSAIKPDAKCAASRAG